MRVILATDGSKDGTAAVEWLTELRGLGAVRRLLLGSVSERVLRRAACPVLVVRERLSCR